MLAIFSVFDMYDKIYDGFISLIKSNQFYYIPINPKWNWLIYIFLVFEIAFSVSLTKILI